MMSANRAGKEVWYFIQVWPRRGYSAACERTIGILNTLVKKQGYKVKLICAQNPANVDIHEVEGVERFYFPSNKQSRPEQYISELLHTSSGPSLAFFDTFVSEEYYTAFIAQNWPECARILDTQDLHGLRWHREHLYSNGASHEEILTGVPQLEDTNLMSDLKSIESGESLAKETACPFTSNDFVREQRAILRSDVVLTCSAFEKAYLHALHQGLGEKQHVPHVGLVSFFYDEIEIDKKLDEFLNASRAEEAFLRRKNYVWLGNFIHRPNLLSSKLLIKEIWPLIHRAQHYQPQLDIYGANFSQEISLLSKSISKGSNPSSADSKTRTTAASPFRARVGQSNRRVT